ncbi:uncharacterized protein V1510DRAFT_411065 [Dipodascopsis tothii]|uniref:uncharacterized protein n=1 Tax=Dipodascopsis tothii TaxID=44089 RepID=UPI0034CDCC1D
MTLAAAALIPRRALALPASPALARPWPAGSRRSRPSWQAAAWRRTPGRPAQPSRARCRRRRRWPMPSAVPWCWLTRPTWPRSRPRPIASRIWPATSPRRRRRWPWPHHTDRTAPMRLRWPRSTAGWPSSSGWWTRSRPRLRPSPIGSSAGPWSPSTRPGRTRTTGWPPPRSASCAPRPPRPRARARKHIQYIELITNTSAAPHELRRRRRETQTNNVFWNRQNHGYQ